MSPLAQIGDELQAGQPVAEIGGQIVSSPIMGVLRGLLHPDVEIKQGTKIGDIDPRNDPALCNRVSDKSLAVGGGVLEAILTRPEVRSHLWS
jgi:xanthine dehydrogenase accessory factor